MEKKITKRELIEWLRKIEMATHKNESNLDFIGYEINKLIDEIGIRGISDLNNSYSFPIGSDGNNIKNNIVDLVDKTTIKVPDIESMRNNKHR